MINDKEISASSNGVAVSDVAVCKQLINNELLCYLINKMDVMTHDLLVKITSDFYQSNEIEVAKICLFSVPVVSQTCGRLKKRQGASKDKNNVEDILQALHKCNHSELPTFCANKLSKLPPIDMNNVDITVIMREFCSMRKEFAMMRQEIASVKSAPAPRVSTEYPLCPDSRSSDSEADADRVYQHPLVVALPLLQRLRVQ